MGFPVIQVDAFTDEPFSGNPAAVCILPGPMERGWMQKVAREINLSETAFLYEKGECFNLQWFTPTVEVDLCGHATLASAHVLWEDGYLKSDAQACFSTRSGLLTTERKGDWIEMNFPADSVAPVMRPSLISRALRVKPIYVGKSRFDYLVEVDSEETLRNIKPDFNLLADLPVRGIIVTSWATSPEYDFVSRFFAPRLEVNEDPVTGSMHCCLGPFWKDRLLKDQFIAYQATARGGVIRVQVEKERVLLGGQAVTVVRGELL